MANDKDLTVGIDEDVNLLEVAKTYMTKDPINGKTQRIKKGLAEKINYKPLEKSDLKVSLMIFRLSAPEWGTSRVDQDRNGWTRIGRSGECMLMETAGWMAIITEASAPANVASPQGSQR